LSETTRNAELRLDSDIALKNLTVIPDTADDADDPVLRQAGLLAEIIERR